MIVMICVINNIKISNEIIESIVACVDLLMTKITIVFIFLAWYVEIIIIIVDGLTMSIIKEEHLSLHLIIHKITPRLEIVVDLHHVDMILISTICSDLIVTTVNISLLRKNQQIINMESQS